MRTRDDGDEKEDFRDMLDVAKFFAVVVSPSPEEVEADSEYVDDVACRSAVLALQCLAREAGLPPTTEPKHLVHTERLLAVAVAAAPRLTRKARVHKSGRVTGHLQAPPDASGRERSSYDAANLLLYVLRKYGIAGRELSVPSQ